jgi:hypothetical protein
MILGLLEDYSQDSGLNKGTDCHQQDFGGSSGSAHALVLEYLIQEGAQGLVSRAPSRCSCA